MGIMVCAAIAACGAFGPQTFSADEGCGWTLMEASDLRMNAAYIAGPLPDEDRAAWLERVREYRRMVREGGGTPVVTMTFDGVRAWVRLGKPLARALKPTPAEILRVGIEARAATSGSGPKAAATTAAATATRATRSCAEAVGTRPKAASGTCRAARSPTPAMRNSS